MAPCQSEVELIQAPSTQLPVWTTVTLIVLVERFADSNVPVHVPEHVREDAGGARRRGRRRAARAVDAREKRAEEAACGSRRTTTDQRPTASDELSRASRRRHSAPCGRLK